MGHLNALYALFSFSATLTQVRIPKQDKEHRQSEFSTGKEGDQEGGVQVTQPLCCHEHMEMPWPRVHSGCQGAKALEALKGKFSAVQGFLGLHRPCYLLCGKQRDNLSEVTQLNSH